MNEPKRPELVEGYWDSGGVAFVRRQGWDGNLISFLEEIARYPVNFPHLRQGVRDVVSGKTKEFTYDTEGINAIVGPTTTKLEHKFAEQLGAGDFEMPTELFQANLEAWLSFLELPIPPPPAAGGE